MICWVLFRHSGLFHHVIPLLAFFEQLHGDGDVLQGHMKTTQTCYMVRSNMYSIHDLVAAVSRNLVVEELSCLRGSNLLDLRALRVPRVHLLEVLVPATRRG